MSLSCFQRVVMIRLASSSSPEANAMLSLRNGWLEWSEKSTCRLCFLVMEVDENGVTVLEQGQGWIIYEV